MYSMKEACTLTNMTYENLKFYCNEGLVPNVKRDRRNYRVFDEHDIKWIQSLNCLKSCGMSIAEMKQYLALCMEGEGTIPERKVILAEKKETLLQSITELQKAVAYIDWKQRFYDDVLSGKTAYYSNLAYDVFIYSSIIHISAPQYCISNTAVTQIEFLRAFKVFLTSDVVSLNIIKYKSIAQILNVFADGYMIGWSFICCQ